MAHCVWCKLDAGLYLEAVFQHHFSSLSWHQLHQSYSRTCFFFKTVSSILNIQRPFWIAAVMPGQSADLRGTRSANWVELHLLDPVQWTLIKSYSVLLLSVEPCARTHENLALSIFSKDRSFSRAAMFSTKSWHSSTFLYWLPKSRPFFSYKFIESFELAES